MATGDIYRFNSSLELDVANRCYIDTETGQRFSIDVVEDEGLKDGVAYLIGKKDYVYFDNIEIEEVEEPEEFRKIRV